MAGPDWLLKSSTTQGKLPLLPISIQVVQFDIVTNISYSLNCRLPQTPRSPFAAASHYFDDIFSRSGRPQSSRRPSVRRSSTNRSIGNRSDFNSTIAGDATPSAVLDDEYVSSPISRRGSTAAASQNGEDEEEEEHVHNFVASELQRVRSSASIAAYEDELETKAEGQNGNRQNGHS